MDLVDLMYKYINRFINCNELYIALKQIDLSSYSKKEKEIINKLITDIEFVKENVPNEIDSIEKKRLEETDKILGFLEDAKQNSQLDKKSMKFINQRYESLLKAKEKICDGGKRYQEVFKLMTNNSLINKYAKKMNDKELLEFITRYISVPMPPKINQEAFNDLVKVGIEEDKRESLWRLAFNYNFKNMDFSPIEDYFIEKRDYYYLTELISAVSEDLNIEKLIRKVIDTKDKEFIKNVLKDSENMGILENEYLEILKKKIS